VTARELFARQPAARHAWDTLKHKLPVCHLAVVFVLSLRWVACPCLLVVRAFRADSRAFRISN
jgi:hypothetical protein